MVHVDSIAEPLRSLAEKYETAAIRGIEVDDCRIVVECDKGTYSFYYDFSKPAASEYIDVPLFHWRSKRRFLELRNILMQNIVTDPVGARMRNLSPRCEVLGSIDDVMVMEFDLLEWILGDTIHRVFCCMASNEYCNLVLATRRGLKASMELGLLSDSLEPIRLHEIICRTGVVSDIVVDTQIDHHSTYLYSRDGVTTYSDSDFELYGIDNTLADCMRFVLSVLDHPEEIVGLNSRCEHYRHLRDLAIKSSMSVSCRAVEEVCSDEADKCSHILTDSCSRS